MASKRIPLVLGTIFVIGCLASWMYLGVWQTLLFASIFSWSIGIHFDSFLLKERANSVLLITSTLFAGLVAGGFALYAHLVGIELELSPVNIAIGVLIGVGEVVWLLFYFEALRIASQKKGFDEERAEEATSSFFQTEALFGLLIALAIPAFHNEVPLSPKVLIGGAIVVAAAFWLNFNDGTRRLNWAVIWRMSLTTLIIGAIGLAFEYLADDAGAGFVATTFWMSIGIFATGFVMFIIRRRYRQELVQYVRTQASWKDAGLILINEVFDQTAILMFQLAAILGSSVVAVQAAKSVQPLLIMLIGGIIAIMSVRKEKGERRSFWSIAKTIVCVILLCAGSIPIMLA